ncbi:17015_t:CDS:2 [Funneliformis geosporum]|nr:17015_t:CDS:2 [Funneliformis geosporum]
MVINLREELNICQKQLEKIRYQEPDNPTINAFNKKELKKLYKLVRKSRDLSAEINQAWGKKDTKNELKFFLSNLKRKIIEFETKRIESGNYREFPLFLEPLGETDRTLAEKAVNILIEKKFIQPSDKRLREHRHPERATSLDTGIAKKAQQEKL